MKLLAKLKCNTKVEKNCDWCGESIAVGEVFHEHLFRDGDYLSRFLFHVECEKASLEVKGESSGELYKRGTSEAA
jgi:hypothetical protein